jgi:hypothetical protein
MRKVKVVSGKTEDEKAKEVLARVAPAPKAKAIPAEQVDDDAADDLNQAYSLQETIKRYEEQLKVFKENIIGRCRGNEIPGYFTDDAKVSVTLVPGRQGLDMAKLLEIVPPDVLAKCMKQGDDYWMTRITGK